MATQQGKKILGFRLTQEKIDYIETVLSNVMKEKNMEKPDSLYFIIELFNNTLKNQTNVEYSKIKPFECNFLNYSQVEYYCFEPMSSSKKPVPLGNDEHDIRTKCKACFEGHSIAENERKRKLLERDNIRNLTEFYKDFLAMTKQGFNVDCVMCKGALLEKNTVIMSRDGESLFCPNQKMDLVNINNVCKEVSNTVTKSKGCEYLISLEHHVNFKGSDVDEKIKEILPKLKQLENEKEE
jgi:hypothetical protein